MASSTMSSTGMTTLTFDRPLGNHLRGPGRLLRSGSKESGRTASGRRMSVKAYDRSTDSDIFSLGSFFKGGNHDIDDLFKSFNTQIMSGAGLVSNNQGVQTTMTTSGGGNNQMTTITQYASPLSGTFFPGPSVMLANGQSQLVPSHQRNSIQSLILKRRDSGSLYEGIPSSDDRQEAGDTAESSVHVNQGEWGKDSDTRVLVEPDVEQTGLHINGEQSIGKSQDTEFQDMKEPDNNTEPLEEFSSGEDMDSERLLHRSRRNKRHRSPKMSHLRTNKLHGHGKDKGRTGMTTTELSVAGEDQKLPAIQVLVMSFSRMLDTNRDQFIETLFRAVKLDGVDVVKILCQLVLHKGLRLSSEEMREPESSASVLHVALLCNHQTMAEYLINLQDKDLIMSVYTKPEYRNQTALHVAVANGNQSLVNKLLASLDRRSKRALISTVADGTYFTSSHPDGQLCLTAAAWAGNGDMLVTLAKHGANFAMADTTGNTLMHRVVTSSATNPDKMDHPRMVDKVFEAVGEWAKRCKYKTHLEDQRALEIKQRQITTFQKLLNIQNNNGDTPMSLAAQVGSSLLVYLMNMEKIYKIPQTKLGSISWVTYDVTDISTLALDSYNKFSVLHVLAHNSGKLSRHANLDEETESISLLDAEPVKSLIELKWGVYRWVYVSWMFLHLLFIFIFTYFTFDEYSANLVLAQHGLETNSSPSNNKATHFSINHYLGLFLTLPVIYIILEFIDWFGVRPYSITYMQHQNILRKLLARCQSEWAITGNGPYRFVCFTFSLFTLWWFIMYEARLPGQDIILAMSLLLGWIFILFFTRGCRVTSRFSIMIQKMFFRDLMYFLAVYIVILAAFSISIATMYSLDHKSRSDFPSIMYQMLNIITDLDQRTHAAFEKEESRPLFTKILLIFYAIVAVILLMNMLIAMMNTSYETVRITQCNLFKQQQLSIMLMIERRLVWISWLGRLSERHVWFKEWEDGSVRAYLDVTTTSHTPLT